MRWLLPAIVLCASAATADEPRVTLSEAGYREVLIEVVAEPDPNVAAWTIWFSPSDFTDTRDATLHSIIRVADTQGLEQPDPASSWQACTSMGEPAHASAAGDTVIDPSANQWSCRLTGIEPGVETWFAVIPVDARNLPLASSFTTLSARTDAQDVRTPAPDMSPILYALGAIVLSGIALLSWLRWSDLRRGKTRSRLAHLYVGPAVIALVALTLYPILYGIGLAFTDADQSRLGDESFVGITNFFTVLATPGVLRVTLFTIIWAVVNTAAHVFFGLVLALALNSPGLRGKTLYRTIILLPWAIPAYISVLAWNGMLQPDGLINAVLGTNIDFLASADSARIVVILVNIWLGIPFMMVTLTGGLKALSNDMFEAANLDGVSRWDQLRFLTLPNLKGTLVPVSLLGIIWSFNSFNTIYLLSRGGPYVGFGEPGATDILVTYVFNVAFTQGRYGVAAAWSVLIFLMLMAFSWVYLKRTRAMEANA